MPQRRTKHLPADVLADEFGREKASALGRLGRALEATLAALAQFDAGHSREASATEDRQLRASLVAEASVALWHFVVQREACGLRDMRSSCAITGYRRRSRHAWACCRRKRCGRVSRVANYRT